MIDSNVHTDAMPRVSESSLEDPALTNAWFKWYYILNEIDWFNVIEMTGLL